MYRQEYNFKVLILAAKVAARELALLISKTIVFDISNTATIVAVLEQVLIKFITNIHVVQSRYRHQQQL